MKRVAVCGIFGSAITLGADHHPRPNKSGRLIGPYNRDCYNIVCSGVAITQQLKENNVKPVPIGILGNDALGEQILKLLVENKISKSNMRTVAGKQSTQILRIFDNDGYHAQYKFDELIDTNPKPSFAGISKENTDLAIVTTCGPVLNELMFERLSKIGIPIIWNAYSDCNELSADTLLSNIRRSRSIVVGKAEAQYICNTLGMASIDQVLSEGPQEIIKIEYSSGSFGFELLSAKVHFHQINSAHGNYTPQEYYQIVDGFVSGYASALLAGKEFEESVQNGIQQTERYYLLMNKPRRAVNGVEEN